MVLNWLLLQLENLFLTVRIGENILNRLFCPGWVCRLGHENTVIIDHLLSRLAILQVLLLFLVLWQATTFILPWARIKILAKILRLHRRIVVCFGLLAYGDFICFFLEKLLATYLLRAQDCLLLLEAADDVTLVVDHARRLLANIRCWRMLEILCIG